MSYYPTEAPPWKWPGKVSRAELHDGKVIVTWKDEAQADQAEVDAVVIEYAAYNESIAYRDRRKAAYASIGDQLDMQYWDAVNDTSIWVDHIERVKRDHPKPE